jgi:hypothetical protein
LCFDLEYAATDQGWICLFDGSPNGEAEFIGEASTIIDSFQRARDVLTTIQVDFLVKK